MDKTLATSLSSVCVSVFQAPAEAKPRAARSLLCFHSCYFLFSFSPSPDTLSGVPSACVGLLPPGGPPLISSVRKGVFPCRPKPRHVLRQLGSGSRGQACSRFSLPCKSAPHDNGPTRRSISTRYQHLPAEDPLLSAGKQTQPEVGVLTQHTPVLPLDTWSWVGKRWEEVNHLGGCCTRVSSEIAFEYS